MNDQRTSAAPLHVVFGAGQIGPLVRDALLARGYRVRVVRRSSTGPSDPRVEELVGDVTDRAFAERAGSGARVIYDCTNPPYHEWPRLLLPTANGALVAARTSGAKLVALDCLYMYGRPEGPLAEISPRRPCSKKGELRVALEELRLGALGRGEACVAIGRASDFFGAGLVHAVFGDAFFRRIFAGKRGQLTGDPEMPHAYTYVPDIARALVSLGERADATGVWHLPTAPAIPTQELVGRLGAELGLDARCTSTPKWMLRAAGVLSPFVRELAEMTYQWEVPFEVDDTRFRSTFGYGATSVHEQVRAVARWAQGRYGAVRAA